MRKLADLDGTTGKADIRLDRLADRYLDVVKAALLDEHYLENEVRLNYLHSCATDGKEPDPLKLRDPRTWLPQQLRRLRDARRTGTPMRALAERPMFPYATVGRTGLDHLQECLETIRDESISGDLAACGAWRGGVAIFMRAFLEAHEVEEPRVWVADSFSGPPESAGDADPELDPNRFPNLVADLNMVREGFARFDLLDERARFLQGSLADTLADAPIGELALLHIGDGLAETTAEALDRLYDRLVPGGFVVIEHYDAFGCRSAVERFRADRGISEPVRHLDWTGASWRRSPGDPVAGTPAPAVGQLNRAPLLAPVGERDCDLSVVVVFHNMRREASRTLHSLSRSYQREIEDLDYEVIAVENGSSEDQRLGAELVGGLGAQFRYLELGSDSRPSPAHALNRGIATARGRTIALMVDGAHMLSPGVLRFAMLGLETYAPAIVTTHQWFLGPGQQPQTMEGGYDQDYEDRLLEQIGWPGDGYRLFEIGNCIGDHDWFDGLWESNCLFTPRELLEQVGGFDETFSMPGGGYTNLDLFERLGSTPGVTVVGLLGEASFHQLHGGTTTNQPDVDERHARLMAYRDHYEKVRKRPFRGPGKPRHYVGTVTGAALRTRARWVTSSAFGEAQPRGADGSQQEPVPVPDQLRAEFTEAFWRSLGWRDTTWLGRRVRRAPTDLIAYQELIASLQPDWIVEVRTAGGARALYLASICELVGSGRVLAIQARRRGVLPEHPRITYLTGPPSGEEMRRRVFETVGEGAKALVVIAPANRKVVLDEFEAYAPLVPVGSFMIVENTVLNGHPVQPTYGPGPAEAVQVILKQRGDFVPDHRLERFGFSFNPRGFLRRVK